MEDEPFYRLATRVRTVRSRPTNVRANPARTAPSALTAKVRVTSLVYICLLIIQSQNFGMNIHYIGAILRCVHWIRNWIAFDGMGCKDGFMIQDFTDRV
jgi:hypothetical protein